MFDPIKDHGAAGDNITDDTAAVQASINDAIASGEPSTVFLNGHFKITSPLSGLNTNNLTIKGLNKQESSLRFYYPGVAMNIDAFASGSPTDQFIRVNLEDFTVFGNPQSSHIIRAHGVARSDWKIALREARSSDGIACYLEGCMSNRFHQLEITNNTTAMASRPREGVRMDVGVRAGVSVGRSSNNSFYDLQVDGIGFGIRLLGADQNMFRSGASQGNTIYGLAIASGCMYNTFDGMGFENSAESATGDVVDGGMFTKYINTYSAKKIFLQGEMQTIDGGLHDSVFVQPHSAKRATVQNIGIKYWNKPGAGFVDQGSGTTKRNIRDMQTGNYVA